MSIYCCLQTGFIENFNVTFLLTYGFFKAKNMNFQVFILLIIHSQRRKLYLKFVLNRYCHMETGWQKFDFKL